MPRNLSASGLSKCSPGGRSANFSKCSGRSGSEMTCSPPNHLPRSTSLQRCEQNGPNFPANQSPDFLHAGHLTARPLILFRWQSLDVVITLAVSSGDAPPSVKIFCTPSKINCCCASVKWELLKRAWTILRQLWLLRAEFLFPAMAAARSSASLETDAG